MSVYKLELRCISTSSILEIKDIFNHLSIDAKDSFWLIEGDGMPLLPCEYNLTNIVSNDSRISIISNELMSKVVKNIEQSIFVTYYYFTNRSILSMGISKILNLGLNDISQYCTAKFEYDDGMYLTIESPDMNLIENFEKAFFQYKIDY
jgi:hypothetical protein